MWWVFAGAGANSVYVCDRGGNENVGLRDTAAANEIVIAVTTCLTIGMSLSSGKPQHACESSKVRKRSMVQGSPFRVKIVSFLVLEFWNLI